jgi:hypothetical protein
MSNRLFYFAECALAGACFWTFLFGLCAFAAKGVEVTVNRKIRQLEMKCVEMREMPLGACSRLFGEGK